MAEVRKQSILQKEEAQAETVVGAPIQDTQHVRRATNTGAWITMHPSMVNDTNLGAQEWRYALFLRYGLEPPDLPH